MLTKLAKLANRLDRLRLVREADLADRILNKLAQMKDVPHDDEEDEDPDEFLNEEDELDSQFEEYLGAGDFSDDEDLDDDFSTEEEEAELKEQIEGISALIESGRLNESETSLLSRVIADLKLQLGEPSQAWNVTDLSGEPSMLPIAEARRRSR